MVPVPNGGEESRGGILAPFGGKDGGRNAPAPLSRLAAFRAGVKVLSFSSPFSSTGMMSEIILEEPAGRVSLLRLQRG